MKIMLIVTLAVALCVGTVVAQYPGDSCNSPNQTFTGYGEGTTYTKAVNQAFAQACSNCTGTYPGAVCGYPQTVQDSGYTWWGRWAQVRICCIKQVGGGDQCATVTCDPYAIYSVNDPNYSCCSSPIIVNVYGGDFPLTSPQDGVYFDLDADGGQERTAWTAPTSDVGFLALDRNGNGFIDNGTELFGNHTVPGVVNGFLALAEFDKPENGGNGDGRISAADDVFSALRIWRDYNHDGVSQPLELSTLQELGVGYFSLEYQQVPRRDGFGNGFRYRAKVYDAVGGHMGRYAYDVFFKKAS